MGIRTLQIALTHIAKANVDTSIEKNSTDNLLFVRNKDRMERIEDKSINYLQAYDNYCFLHTDDRRFLLPHTLKMVESRLDDQVFMRVHRSYLVNIQRISAIDELGIEIGGERVPVSKPQRKELLQRIQLL